MSLLLLTSSAIVFVSFMLTGIVQSLRSKVKVGFLSTFLAFCATTLAVLGITLNETLETPIPLVLPVLIASAVVLVVSLILVALDRRQENYVPRYSRGLLGVGAAIVVAILGLLTPVLSNIFSSDLAPTPDFEAIAAQSTTVPEDVTPTNPNTTPTETEVASPTVTRTPSPEPSVTATRRGFEVPSETPTPTVSFVCEATVGANLNLRPSPSTDTEVIGIIPFEARVPLFAVTDNAEWWQTEFEDEIGWVSAEFLVLDDDCISD